MRRMASRRPRAGLIDDPLGTHQAFATLCGTSGTAAHFVYRSGPRGDLFAYRAFRDALANANVHVAKLMLMGMIVNNI